MGGTSVHFRSSHVHDHELIPLRSFAEHEVIDFDVIVYHAFAVKELDDGDLREIRAKQRTLCAAIE